MSTWRLTRTSAPSTTEPPPELHPWLSVGVELFDRLERVAVPTAWRDALLCAVIPGLESPSPGSVATLPGLEKTDRGKFWPALPGLEKTDRGKFWPRFQVLAPIHVRLALAAASVVVGGVLPLLTHGSPLSRLSPDQREALLARAQSLPIARDLLEIAKVIACLAYFEDLDVQTRIRARP